MEGNERESNPHNNYFEPIDTHNGKIQKQHSEKDFKTIHSIVNKKEKDLKQIDSEVKKQGDSEIKKQNNEINNIEGKDFNTIHSRVHENDLKQIDSEIKTQNNERINSEVERMLSKAEVMNKLRKHLFNLDKDKSKLKNNINMSEQNTINLEKNSNMWLNDTNNLETSNLEIDKDLKHIDSQKKESENLHRIEIDHNSRNGDQNTIKMVKNTNMWEKEIDNLDAKTSNFEIEKDLKQIDSESHKIRIKVENIPNKFEVMTEPLTILEKDKIKLEKVTSMWVKETNNKTNTGNLEKVRIKMEENQDMILEHKIKVEKCDEDDNEKFATNNADMNKFLGNSNSRIGVSNNDCPVYEFKVKVEPCSDDDEAMSTAAGDCDIAPTNTEAENQTQEPQIKPKKARKSRSKFNPPRTRRSLNTYRGKFSIEQKDGYKWFLCTICGYGTKRRSDIMIHLDTHAEEKRFKCNMCDYETVRKFSLTLHLSTHTGEKPFACNHCPYTCSRKSYLLIHLKSHESTDHWFSCQMCDFKTTRKCGMQDHVKLHTGEKDFACDFCDFKTVTRGNLKKHLVRHSKVKYQCEQCDYQTCRTRDLSLHMLKHDTEKPFACNVCGFRTNRIVTYRLHISSHFTDKVFECNVCDYKSNRRGNLRSHMKVHAVVKQHKCDLCDFSSAKRQCMQRHVKTHAKGVIFVCPVCNFRCSSKAYLCKHQKEHDSQKKEDLSVCVSDFVATELKEEETVMPVDSVSIDDD